MSEIVNGPVPTTPFVERLERLHAWLASGGDDAPQLGVSSSGEPVKLTFNMLQWIRTAGSNPACSTSACIAGFATLDREFETGLLNPEQSIGAQRGDGGSRTSAIAQGWLGLNHRQAGELFVPDHIRAVTAAWAANVVRHYINTGTIDWRGVPCE